MPKNYLQVRVGHRTMLKHRVIAARLIGRELTSADVVHHKNGDTYENSPENLQVMTHGEHVRHHWCGRFKHSHEFVLDEIRRVTKELGHRPACKRDFEPRSCVDHTTVDRMFGSWVNAVNMALGESRKARSTKGARRHRGPNYIERGDLLSDLSRVEQIVGHYPRCSDYKRHGKFSHMSVIIRFNEPGCFRWPTVEISQE